MANEKRLIDANALMDAFRSHMAKTYDRNKCTLEESCKTCEPGCLWRKKVSEAPTVDAVPVVHGRWVWKPIQNRTWILTCSVCESEEGTSESYNYCPNCGAKMDGD